MRYFTGVLLAGGGKMKRWGAILAAALLACTCFAGCSGEDQDSGKLKVYTSFYTMWDFAQKVGGDRAEVVNLMNTGGEPHDWEPTGKDIMALEKADVFIYSGAGLEQWVDKVLDSLENQDLVVAAASEKVELIEAGDNHGHDHGAVDPHVWLSPVSAKTQLEAIAGAFCRADPDNADYYRENAARTMREFDRLAEEYRDTLEPLPNKSIVVAHEAFGYLCRDYGLTQVAARGFSPDQEPDLGRMKELVDYSRENRITTIFFEEQTSSKVAQVIADEIGAQTAVLSTLEALSEEQERGGDDYFSVMRQNLAALDKALA